MTNIYKGKSVDNLLREKVFPRETQCREVRP